MWIEQIRLQCPKCSRIQKMPASDHANQMVFKCVSCGDLSAKEDWHQRYKTLRGIEFGCLALSILSITVAGVLMFISLVDGARPAFLTALLGGIVSGFVWFALAEGVDLFIDIADDQRQSKELLEEIRDHFTERGG